MDRTRRIGLLHNLNGHPDQLLIIQWGAAVLLTLGVTWNAVVDAYLGHEVVSKPDGGVELQITRFRPVGPDTLMIILAMVGGAGSLYNWRRSQDRVDLRERDRGAPPPPVGNPTPSSGYYSRVPPPRRGPETRAATGAADGVVPRPTDPLDVDPGDPSARL